MWKKCEPSEFELSKSSARAGNWLCVLLHLLLLSRASVDRVTPHTSYLIHCISHDSFQSARNASFASFPLRESAAGILTVRELTHIKPDILEDCACSGPDFTRPQDPIRPPLASSPAPLPFSPHLIHSRPPQQHSEMSYDASCTSCQRLGRPFPSAALPR